MSETKNLKLFKHEEPLGTNNNKFDIDKALNQNWDKVDEYVEKVNTEISNIQEKIGGIDTILDTINGEVI